ncbi:histidine phosphatase family protein [Marinobacterium lutimaris]|uniref:Histidine phosphatase superfamily (Branch 1) n=1 Tax=Marinobacterium lutimaris TaxID=568106 RepID=A0A1H5Z4Z8_9GAMM|nr:histidine phosphatase family protein [Marinobacterium lutimaris]SEG31352.1 Histidine phosphatase superfamily (branch 1) [Marinobacterium lutimaris]
MTRLIACFRHRIALISLTLAAAFVPLGLSAQTLSEAVQEGGGIIVIRHALAPGVGDPANFQLGDCSTQRNLNDEGRDQARAIGKRLQQLGFGQADVYSSQWCRCLDTSELLGIGEVQPQPLLNSFFRNASAGVDQTSELKNWLAQRGADRPAVLITHQVNITALLDIYPSSGEMILIRMEEGEPVVIAREETR